MNDISDIMHERAHCYTGRESQAIIYRYNYIRQRKRVPRLPEAFEMDRSTIQ